MQFKNRSGLTLRVFIILVLSGLSANTRSLFAQEKKVDTDAFYWLRLRPTLNLQNNWSVTGEIESRRFMFPDRRHQFLLPRVTVYKRLENNYSVGLGMVYFRQVIPQDENISPQEVRPEIRPHQDLIMRESWGRLKISHRYRFEQRFRHKSEGFELKDGWNLDFRMRYRLQFVIPLNEKEGFGDVDIKIYDEVMINIGDDVVRNTFDQNRFHIGGSTSLSDKMDLEIGIINWFQQESSGDDFRSRYILRTTLSYAL